MIDPALVSAVEPWARGAGAVAASFGAVGLAAWIESFRHVRGSAVHRRLLDVSQGSGAVALLALLAFEMGVGIIGWPFGDPAHAGIAAAAAAVLAALGIARRDGRPLRLGQAALAVAAVLASIAVLA